MRAPFLALAMICLCGAAGAQAAPDAQAAYAERRALLEADRLCALFTPAMRASLEAAAGQARGALLRGGWTMARLEELDRAAASAARARRCGDPRTEEAARRARLGFQSWAQTHAMRFPGAERAWDARRTPDPADGFMLKQVIETPRAGTFGVRVHERREELALVLTGGTRQRVPASAELVIRDVARAPRSLMDLPGRTARGLAAGAPAAATARTFQARARRIEGADIVFVFPDAALNALAALDPRESAIINLGGRTPQRLYVELGDLAAARAFLTAQNIN